MASHLIILLLVGLLAGVFGAILGIGGGMIITPVLTIGMGLDIKYAIGASIIAVIATSSGATIAYLKDEMLNLRVAMFLEIATTVGAIVGAIMTGIFNSTVLYVLFGSFLVFSSWNMYRKLRQGGSEEGSAKNDRLANRLNLSGSYYDRRCKNKLITKWKMFQEVRQ